MINSNQTFFFLRFLSYHTKSIEVGRHDNTFELHIRTRRDKSQLPIRGSVSLPRSFAKEVAILVFTTGDKAEEAKAAGAHTVGGMEFIEEVRCVVKRDPR